MILLPLLAGVLCYIATNDVLVGFIGGAVVLAPVLVCYLSGNGPAVFDAFAKIMNGVGLFSALAPFTHGVMDLSVIIGCLLGAVLPLLLGALVFRKCQDRFIFNL